MMMRMLEAGGLPLLTDDLRGADPDNPEGYFEYERVKALDKGDRDWLPEAQGKAVKVISALLEHLPPDYSYRVLFMNRRIEEVLASQRKMLARRGEPGGPDDEKLADLFARHLRKVKAWLATQPNIAVLEMNYNSLLRDPAPHARQVNAFLGGNLDVERMIAIVNPDLYRNRSTCG